MVVSACGGNAATNQPAGSTPPAGATSTAATAIQCGVGSGGTAATIANFAFSPSPVTVSSGGTATWTNNDSTTHTVTFDSGPNCGNVASGASVTATFSVAGTYAYHCSIHPSMKGSVTVNG